MSEAKTGFTRGFFGCFGVLAAVVLVVVAFLSLGQCAPQDRVASAENRNADAVVACGLALTEAQRTGKTSSDAQLQVPWRVYEMTGAAAGARRVSCAAVDSRGEMGVIVDVVCTDVNDAKCHPLVSIARP